jgi:hypothetical protein
MFKSRYLLSDVARILHRSESSLKRDAEIGLLKLRTSGYSRTSAGSGEIYSMTLSDLVRYMGKDEAYAAFGSATHRKALEPSAHPEHPLVEAKYKKCRICGRLKPISDFPREASSTHWLAAECLQCRAKHKM